MPETADPVKERLTVKELMFDDPDRVTVSVTGTPLSSSTEEVEEEMEMVEGKGTLTKLMATGGQQ